MVKWFGVQNFWVISRPKSGGKKGKIGQEYYYLAFF